MLHCGMLLGTPLREHGPCWCQGWMGHQPFSMIKVECTRKHTVSEHDFSEVRNRNCIWVAPRCTDLLRQLLCEALLRHLPISILETHTNICLFMKYKRPHVDFQEWKLHCGMLLRTPERTWAMLIFRMDVARWIAPKHFWERAKIAVWIPKNACCTVECS